MMIATPPTETNVAPLRKPVSLALQGGGSWGAYTWGVLDTLLASRRIVIDQLSGTSAGAINAAIVASALAHGSASEARQKLRSFWLAIARPAVADLGRELWGPVERHWRDTVGMWLMSGSTLSPYHTNPLGMNPLRDAIGAHVDVEAIRGPSAPRLYVTLTNVRSGLPRNLANDAITIDALLASACLPQLFQAVEIDGEPYWDGGYSANPSLWPLVDGASARDLIVVQLVRDEAPDLPTDGVSIRRRIGEIVSQSSLAAEVRALAAMRSVAAQQDEFPALRLHRIGPPDAALSHHGSALERSRAWIERLHHEGRRAARRFLARHLPDLGVRETLDVARVFGGGRGTNELAQMRTSGVALRSSS